MTAFFVFAFAKRIAGTRYARLLPTPVPASTARCSRRSNARATATAISCCCGRNSKFFARERIPVGEKISSTCRTRSTLEPAGCCSTMLIIGARVCDPQRRVTFQHAAAHRAALRCIARHSFHRRVHLMHVIVVVEPREKITHVLARSVAQFG